MEKVPYVLKFSQCKRLGASRRVFCCSRAGIATRCARPITEDRSKAELKSLNFSRPIDLEAPLLPALYAQPGLIALELMKFGLLSGEPYEPAQAPGSLAFWDQI